MSNDVPIRLPKSGERNVLITSALPYANNVPHLGNIIGCVLSADVYSRYLELAGVNKIYICGTDEYGTATETKAAQRGISEQELCDEYHALQKGIYDWFEIGFDHWSRTTTQQQTAIAQDIFLQCEKNGYIVEKETTQLFCEKCDKFLADRYVAGTCPHKECQYDDAKGDQCDKCSQLLNAIDLVNPRCITCSSTPIQRQSQHLFLDLPQLEPKLRAFIDKKSSNWTANNVQTTESWLKSGLQPRCITRDLKWGTKVPKEGFENKVFYVWFDAPIGYISITAGLTKDTVTPNNKTTSNDVDYTITQDWAKWWKNPQEVELVQFMGKDNIPFHSIIFPSTLLASGDNWTMVDRLSTTEYLNYESGKFSKTRGTGVFGDQAKDTGIPVEIWRYYLLATRPEKSDAIFTWDDLASKLNNELLKNLGNLVHRCLSFITSSFNSIIHRSLYDLAITPTQDELTLEKTVSKLLIDYIIKSDQIKIKDALAIAMEISSAGNLYMQTVQPWFTVKTDKQRGGAQLTILFNLLYLIAIIFYPFMPSFSNKVLQQLNLTLPQQPLKHIDITNPDAIVWPILTIYNQSSSITNPLFPLLHTTDETHTIGQVGVIFTKLEPSTVETLRQKYQGQVQVQASVEWGLQTKVGEIMELAEHPKNPNSYLLQVDIGEVDPDGNPKYRQIVSGVRNIYTEEQLKNKKVIVCANLKPSNFQGSRSEGMILGAGAIINDIKQTVFVFFDENNEQFKQIKNGDMCLPTNAKFTGQKVFDWKSKNQSLEFSIEDNGVVYAGGVEFVVHQKNIPCVAIGMPKGAKVQ